MTTPPFTIVLVEDDNVDAAAVRRAMRTRYAHINVVVHSTATDALAAPQLQTGTREPCLVVVDINLPGMGGHELVRQLRRLSEPPPILMLTTSADRHDQATAWNNGVMGYFLKPIEANAWGPLIDTIISYWSHCHWNWPSTPKPD